MEKFAACIGNFDGVHIGHQKLIAETVRIAREKGLKSRMITFSPSPAVFFSDKTSRGILSDDKMKKQYALQYGIDDFYLISFSRQMADTPADDFMSIYLNGSVDTLICGNDFTFGKNAMGNVSFLMNSAQRDFNVHVVDDICFKGKRVSSTRIIEAIRKGKISFAERMLGHQYMIRFSAESGIISTEYVLPNRGRIITENSAIKFINRNGQIVCDMSENMQLQTGIVTYSF